MDSDLNECADRVIGDNLKGSSDKSDEFKSDGSTMSNDVAAHVLFSKVYLSGIESPIADCAAVIEQSDDVTLSTVLQSKLTTDGFEYADEIKLSK